MLRRRTPFVYVIVLLVGSVLFILADRTVPPQHLPWKTLDVDAPIGIATSSQLMRVSLSPSSVCRKHAAQAETLSSIEADPHRPNGEECGWGTARIFYGSDKISLSPGETTMQCPLMLGGHLWLREADRLALDMFGAPIVKVHHAGTYSCRRQVGNNSGQMSEHAYANAWDITGFELEGGRVISVKTGWNGAKGERKFLREVRDVGCRIFRVTLSPDYNKAHHDHFHLDMGPSVRCG